MSEFNPMDYPISSMDPMFFGAASAWTTHIPFGFSLVEMAQPRTLVELGTCCGDSYCALCQAVAAKHLPTRCFAVDTWQGDAHTGFYNGDQLLQALRSFHDPNFGKFSELLRMDFDTAVGRFAEGSIDLLHIDGCHTYEAVKHDFETWLPKISPAGVVMLHDVTARQPGFGVWQFWEEIAPKYPSFAFEHGWGLGILAVGNSVPEKVMRFLDQANTQPSRVRDYFNWRGIQATQARTYTSLLKLAQMAQNLANEWRRQSGQPVDPVLADPAKINSDPVRFFSHTLEQIRQAMVENLQLRVAQRPNPVVPGPPI
jgi:hypothetical protein